MLERETIARLEPWRRLSGMHTLKSTRQLAAARALWIARDDYAREIDTAPGRLVPDASLVVAARALPATKKDLAAIKEFTGRASRGQLDRWFDAIQAGIADPNPPALRVPSEGPPPPRLWADRNPDADRRLKAARVAVGEKAAELDLPVENLLTPESLRRLAWTPPEPVTAGDDRRRTRGARRPTLAARGHRRVDRDSVHRTAFVEPDQTAPDAAPPAS